LKDKERPKPISDIEKKESGIEKWFYCFSDATSQIKKVSFAHGK
jgi:hypothetical protein